MPASHAPGNAHRLLRDLVAAFNEHDAGRVVACFSPDFEGVDVAEAHPQQGPRSLRQSVERYLAAFPDLVLTPDELFVEDRRAILVWTARGTHLGSLMHIPPTGRPVVLRGATLFGIEEGTIRRATNIWDVAGFLRAAGLLPDLMEEAPPAPRTLSPS